jgi:hypothetical protein
MTPIQMLKAGIFTKGSSKPYGPAAKFDRKPAQIKDSIPNGYTCRRLNQKG